MSRGGGGGSGGTASASRPAAGGLRALPAGPFGLLLDFDSLEDVQRCFGWVERWRATHPAGGVLVDVVPAERTLMAIATFDDAGRRGLREFAAAVVEADWAAAPGDSDDPGGLDGLDGLDGDQSWSGTAEPVSLPVRYDGPDLDEVARLTGLSMPEIVALHTETEFTVAFTGFAPGFAYLTGLPEVLRVPRREAPRTRVPAGSVALGGPYAGVYPRESPGGWQLIGRLAGSAPALWDETRESPALLRPGMRVRFRDVAGRPGDPAGESATELALGDRAAALDAEGGGAGLRIVRAGPLTTVQDLGRPGFAHLGVPRSGAVDRTALKLANRLVGNAEDAAALELTLGGGAVQLEVGRWVAVAGARCEVTVKVPLARGVDAAAVGGVEGSAVGGGDAAAAGHAEAPAVGGAESAALGGVEVSAAEHVESAAVERAGVSAAGRVESAALSGAEVSAAGRAESAGLGGVEVSAAGGAEGPVVGGGEAAAAGRAESAAVGRAGVSAAGRAEGSAVGGGDAAAAGHAEAPAVGRAESAALGGGEVSGAGRVGSAAVGGAAVSGAGRAEAVGSAAGVAELVGGGSGGSSLLSPAPSHQQMLITRTVPGTAFYAPEGTVVDVGAAAAGVRAYLAVAGGLGGAGVLGSRAVDLLSGVGGRALGVGDRVAVGEPAALPPDIPGLGMAPLRDVEDPVVVRLVLGPRDEWFTDAAVRALVTAQWTVGVESNRTAVRLDGAALEWAREAEPASEPLVVGAVQVPRDGRPVLFLADHPVTGGYPVIACAHPADLDAVGQARPGTGIRFRMVGGGSGGR